jgi:diacylglycerol kinase family enzyme
LKNQLEKKYTGLNYTVVSQFEDFDNRLQSEFERGERILVAAGGDGTVNFLLNCIMNMKETQQKQVVLGAIGLGSSNDFHKPFTADGYLIGNVPARLDYQNAAPHNIGRVDFQDEHHQWRRKYFIINSSIGITAYANNLFNSREIVIDFLKPRWVQGAIWYAALKTLLRSPNISARISIGDEHFETKVTNLGVFINPHFSGSLCYDFDVSTQGDCFGAALCERMGIPARLKTILSLTKARFSHLPGTRVWKTPGIEIYLDSTTPLEMDGEVCCARQLKITLIKGGLRVCR